MHWLFLSLAIVTEVLATTALKYADGFTKPIPTGFAVLSLTLSMYLLSLTLRVLPVGIAYAIWAGAGIVLVSLIGLVVFAQKLDLPAVLGIGFILAGVLLINVFSSSAQH